MAIPWWLQLLLGVFKIVEPQFAWLGEVLVLAYEIWQAIPWFHKAGALIELRKAVALAKASASIEPIKGFNTKWKVHLCG